MNFNSSGRYWYINEQTGPTHELPPGPLYATIYEQHMESTVLEVTLELFGNVTDVYPERFLKNWHLMAGDIVYRFLHNDFIILRQDGTRMRLLAKYFDRDYFGRIPAKIKLVSLFLDFDAICLMFLDFGSGADVNDI